MRSFIEYLETDAMSQLSVVRRAKCSQDEEYQPAKDYWGPLRQRIISMHKQGHDGSELDSVAHKVSASKQKNYLMRVQQYKKWMIGQDLKWSGVLPQLVKLGPLTVKLSPELGIIVSGTDHVFKLYFKAEKLTKSQRRLRLHLLALPMAYPGRTPAILDISRSKTIIANEATPELDATLIVQAEAFVKLWHQV